jgi:allantoicase
VADHNTVAFTDLPDLASSRLGGRAIATNDDFFASKSNLIKPESAIFIPGKFTTRGKWMDGWESRRRRTPGHDWCVVALGSRGVIHGFDIDTSHFTGNYPSHCSIDVVDTPVPLKSPVYAAQGAPWTNVLPKSPLVGNSHNLFEISGAPPCTHVRLNIFPDGGVARLRVYGEVEVDWRRAARGGRPLDLALILNGGLVLGASDMHFGAKDNMIMPGRARNMGDGWETRRRRGPGYDWAIVRLGSPALVQRIELDTNHFKGNYPDSASIDGVLAPEASLEKLRSAGWKEILPRQKLSAHRRHLYAKELSAPDPISHVRLNIYPDGGVSRLRVYGSVAAL